MDFINKANQTASVKKELDIDCYVIISTQNQIVNYLPYVLYKDKIKTIYNITISDSEKNQKWDNNLKNVLTENIKNISFKAGEYGNIDTVISKLKSEISPNAKILWNITGGQKAFLLAVNSLANERTNDFIGYVEGNADKFLIYQNNRSFKEDSTNVLNQFTIASALNLMGFSQINPEQVVENLIPLYEEIYNKYISDEPFRVKLRSLKKVADLNSMDFGINNCKEHFQTLKPDANQALLGKIFEEMVFYYLKKHLNQKLLEIAFGVKIKFFEEQYNIPIDEFDTLILSTSGQLINIECKSGSTHKEDMKSHHYSTLVTSGIYGLPILATPLLQSEIDLNDKRNDSISELLNTVKSAKRAGVTVVPIDKLLEIIKSIIH